MKSRSSESIIIINIYIIIHNNGIWTSNYFAYDSIPPIILYISKLDIFILLPVLYIYDKYSHANLELFPLLHIMNIFLQSSGNLN